MTRSCRIPDPWSDREQSTQDILSEASWSRMSNLNLLQVLMVSTVSSMAARGARFPDVGGLLKLACSSRSSPSNSSFRWMVLKQSRTQLTSTMVTAVKRMSCAYEVRATESLQLWNMSGVMAYVDYKVIAIGVPIRELRQMLNIYVSSVYFS